MRGTNSLDWAILKVSDNSNIGTLKMYAPFETAITYANVYVKFGEQFEICIREGTATIAWQATCSYKIESINLLISLFIKNKPIGNFVILNFRYVYY